MWNPVSVTHVRVGVNMGDHAAEVSNAITVSDDTTVSQLVNKLLVGERISYKDGGPTHEPDPKYDDFIVLRLAWPFEE